MNSERLQEIVRNKLTFNLNLNLNLCDLASSVSSIKFLRNNYYFLKYLVFFMLKIFSRGFKI